MPTPEELKELNKARKAEIYEKFQRDAAAMAAQPASAPAAPATDEGGSWSSNLRKKMEGMLPDGLIGKFQQVTQQISEGKSPLLDKDGVGLSGVERKKTVDAIVDGTVGAPQSVSVIKPPGS